MQWVWIKTLSDRDTHIFISDRDTSYCETDIDLNESDKDTSNFSGKIAKTVKGNYLRHRRRGLSIYPNKQKKETDDHQWVDFEHW